jgi:WD40 repeat protein
MFSPDGDSIATSSSDGTIRIWDLETGRLVESLEAHSSWVICAEFSPEGELLLSGDHDGAVRLWSTQSWSEIGTLVGHTDLVSDVDFVPNGSMAVSTSFDNTVIIWDVEKGEKLYELAFDAKYVNAVDIDPTGNNLVVALGADHPDGIRAELIDLNTRENMGTVRGHEPWPVAFARWAQDERSKEVAEDIQRTDYLYGEVSDIHFIRDGRAIVTVGDDGQLIVTDSSTFETILKIQAHESSITGLAISPDESMAATVAGDTLVRVHDLTDGVLRFEFGGHPPVVQAVAFSPDGSILATGSHDGQLRMWRLTK